MTTPPQLPAMRIKSRWFRSDAPKSAAEQASAMAFIVWRVAQQMLNQLKPILEARGVMVENVLLRDIKLPDTLRNAIEAKQQADQQSQQMQFVLQRERQEADRKRIEAQGVADFQRIVSTGISDQLLQWKGIEATEKLVNSPNSKVVVIGNPKNGLPLILGQ